MSDAYILGVAQTAFARHPLRTVRDLALEAARDAVRDASIELADVEAVFFANSLHGIHDGQHLIRSQVALQETPLAGKAMVNVENACAGGSTALHLASMAVRSGQYERVLAVGVDKVFVPDDPPRTFAAFATALDVARTQEQMNRLLALRDTSLAALRRERPELAARVSSRDAGGGHSIFMDVYAAFALWHMARHGSTPEQLAAIAAKNHRHGAANPKAQIRIAMTPAEVLSDRLVSWPLTRSMCAPIGDGAAAAVVVSEREVRTRGRGRAIRIRASALASGTARPLEATGEDVAARAARAAYARAALGPDDVHVAEIHDATAFGELHQLEALGFCPEGRGGEAAVTGESAVGGRRPINPSGGLECRGHPIAASGLAQIHEIVLQLRGDAAGRQASGARIGLTENGGGNLGYEEAALCIHILEG
jgi:acetyl-CoA acetyltransferase